MIKGLLLIAQSCTMVGHFEFKKCQIRFEVGACLRPLREPTIHMDTFLVKYDPLWRWLSPEPLEWQNFCLIFFWISPKAKAKSNCQLTQWNCRKDEILAFIHHQRLKQGKNFYIPKGFLKGKIYRYIYYYTMYNFVLYFGILSKFSFRYFFIVELWSFNSWKNTTK